MRLGIDFGTTRTLVALVDRGNYPVVTFADHDGDPSDHFPSVVALRDGDLVYGFEALDAGAAGAPMVRSFKRALAAPDVTLTSPVAVGERAVPISDLLTGYLVALRAALAESSSLHSYGELDGETPIEVVIAVPAHAHGAQRFITMEAFRRAGFTVLGMMNEPSAAGFEFTHRQGRAVTSKRTRVLVYDLGGGTFDASLVRADGTDHEVLNSVGINRLGGDDFDASLAGTALSVAGTRPDELDPTAYAVLLDECRDAKERLSPQTKRIVVDVADRAVTVPVAAFESDATPLVEQTIEAMAPLVGVLDETGGDELADIAGIYLVGGASGLPLVPRVLRSKFGRRVFRSPYPAASTAIGLAIAADPVAGYSLTDRLSRGFGVYREASEGTALQFDEVFTRDDVLAGSGDEVAVVATRRYRAVHNLGWFRFVEYAALDDAGQPKGDLVPFAEVLFPFDAALEGVSEGLQDVEVSRLGHGPLVEERYAIDRHGIVEVTITNLDTGHTRRFALDRSGEGPTAG